MFTTHAVFVIDPNLGGPGVGKGTQCSRLKADLKLEHISVGNLLREEAKRPTSVYAEFIETSIRESVIIPAQLTCDLIKLKLNEAMKRGYQHFLIDGFPRSVDQALKFEEKVGAYGLRLLLSMLMFFKFQIHEQNFTISMDCSEEVMASRITERANASSRIDDNDESVVKRLRTFRDGNQAVEKHLREKGPFKSVSALLGMR
jgi:adenylate kinase family enzyme